MPPGLGGGSSDAAACLKACSKLWSSDIDFKPLALQIGSDIPVCLAAKPAIMRGIGDIILPVPPLPVLHAVLIWPGQIAPTPDVYKNLRIEKYSEEFLFDPNNLIDGLKRTRNDLENSAFELFPVIQEALTVLRQNPDCLFARMSGSGSSVFGIFESKDRSIQSAEKIKAAYPDWWVRSCRFNSCD